MSSITGIFSNGLMGLNAQAHALETVSGNIANASTVGFKESETQFGDFVLNGGRNGATTGGDGVLAQDRLMASKQGAITSTSVKTNAAISGNGFFVVEDVNPTTGQPVTTKTGQTANSTQLKLTRAGDFQVDQWGHFVNGGGRALMGYKLDPANPNPVTGNLADLQLVTTADMRNYAEATSSATYTANLPGDAAVATTPTATNTVGNRLSVVDLQGKTASVDLRFMKSDQQPDGTSTWQVFNAGTSYDTNFSTLDPHSTDPATWTPVGTLSFDATGNLAGTAGTPVSLPLTLGDGFAPISVNLGKAGEATNSTTARTGQDYSSVNQTNNGIAKGSWQDVQITSDGVVQANFANGATRAMYQIPDALVQNSAGLANVSGNAFDVTTQSGAIQLGSFRGAAPGTGLTSGAVENSTVTLENQFSTLITAQRSYSANSKVVTTADEMTQTVAGLMR